MNFHLVIILTISCIYATGVSCHEHDDRKRQVAATQPAATVAVTQSPAEALMQLKLLTYQAKLKAKEDKKKAKAEKKAQKDAAFTAYMTAISQGALAPPAGPAGAPAGGAPGAVAPPPAPAAVVPPMPMLPAMGLWKKSFLLSQIMAAAAAQNAAIAAAAAAAATTTVSPTTAEPVAEDDEESDEDKTINEIVKRYAPILRKKFYGDQKYNDEYESEEADENQEEPEEDENQEDDAENVPAGADEAENGDEDEDPASYQSGSFNKFGTGPAGSPNGVGYEDAKVNQAGCSGSHIHICSGTTVYLTNPDEVSNQNPILQNSELKPFQAEAEDEEVVKPAKFGKKHAHHRRH